jgi:hypothetical protein
VPVQVLGAPLLPFHPCILIAIDFFFGMGVTNAPLSAAAMPTAAHLTLAQALFLILIHPSVLFEHLPSTESTTAPISIAILRAQMQRDAGDSGGGGQLQVTWVLTSDAAVLSDGSNAIQTSLLTSCPKIYWDEYTLFGPDSFPNSHCGGMFATSLPLLAAMLAPGVHTLRLMLDDPPAPSRMYCIPELCNDSVLFHIHASSQTISSNNLLPGGTLRCSSAAITLTLRQAFP